MGIFGKGSTHPQNKQTTQQERTTPTNQSYSSTSSTTRSFQGPQRHQSPLFSSSSSTQHSFRPEEKIRLDVGGSHFATTASTLTRIPKTKLEKLGKNDSSFINKSSPVIQKEGTSLSGHHSSNFFIDRDGTHFNIILNFLRDGDVDVPNDVITAKQLLREAIFYEIQPLIDLIKKHFENNVSETTTSSLSVPKEHNTSLPSNIEEKNPMTGVIQQDILQNTEDLVFLPTYERTVTFNNCSKWETVFSKQVLAEKEKKDDENDEYRIRMRIKSFAKGNNSFGLIVGLVSPEHSKDKQIGKGGTGYGYIALKGDRFDGRKSDYGSTFGAGDEVGIILNTKEKTISFEVNGRNQGVAFTSVEMPLHVAISAWCSHAQISLLD